MRLNFAKDFTDCPGGRYRIHGDFSGEEFREDFLEPCMNREGVTVVDLNGVLSFPPSFIDESFGVLVQQYGIDAVTNKLKLDLSDNSFALRKILNAMEGHAA